MRGILIKHGRKHHRHLVHDLIMVDLYLTYMCMLCRAETSLHKQTPELQVEIGFYLKETF